MAAEVQNNPISDITKFITNQKSADDFYQHPLFRTQQQAEKMEYNKEPIKSEKDVTYEQSRMFTPKSLER